MPKVTLDRNIHAGGKVFFQGDAFVTDEDKALIDAELERLNQQESEPEPPKKTKTKSEK